MDRIAVLIDLSSVRMGEHMMRRLLSDMGERGSIVYAKLYNYSSRRHSEFNALIEEYNIETAPSMQGKKRVRIDIREAIDAVRVASREDVDTLLIVASELDSSYLIDSIRDMGKRVIVAGTSRGSMSEIADEFYMLERSSEVDVEAMLASLAHDESAEDIASRLESEVAAHDMEVSQHTKVRGDESSLFPYSDIDMADMDERMQEIDRRLLAVVRNTKRRRRLMDIHRD